MKVAEENARMKEEKKPVMNLIVWNTCVTAPISPLWLYDGTENGQRNFLRFLECLVFFSGAEIEVRLLKRCV